jgi:hypothetical protein
MISEVKAHAYHGMKFQQAKTQWAQSGMYACTLYLFTHNLHAFTLTAHTPLLLVRRLLKMILN